MLNAPSRKYALTKFQTFLTDRGAANATARQYAAGIRDMLIAVEDEAGVAQWRDYARVLAYYRTLEYPVKGRLGSAWPHFLAFQSVELPLLAGPQGAPPQAADQWTPIVAAFQKYMTDNGARPATVLQYSSAIRTMLRGVGVDAAGQPLWREFERVLTYYQMLSYAAQSHLGAAWSWFLRFQNIEMPKLSERPGARPGRTVEVEAPPVDTRRARSLDRGAGWFQYMVRGLESAGVPEPAAALLGLRWGCDGDRWFVHDGAQPLLWSRHFEIMLAAMKEMYYPPGLGGPKVNAPFLLTGIGGEPMSMEALQKWLERPVPPEVFEEFDRVGNHAEITEGPATPPKFVP